VHLAATVIELPHFIVRLLARASHYLRAAPNGSALGVGLDLAILVALSVGIFMAWLVTTRAAH
jgi:hypothetical protein